MGITLGLYIITDEVIELLVRRPELAEVYLTGELPEVKPVGFFGRLMGKKPQGINPDSVPRVLIENAADGTDLDKAWHGIHYLLTGEAEAKDEAAAAKDPRYWLLFAPRRIQHNMGANGESALLNSAEVRQFWEMLQAVTEGDFRSRYDPAAMDKAGIYPEGIWGRDGDEALEYLVEYFRGMKSFVKVRVDQGEGIYIELG